MGKKFFQDVTDVRTRPLISADGVRMGCDPACYLIENEETGSLYVGSTKNATGRVNSHLQRLKNGNHANTNLQKEFAAAQDKFSFKIHVAFMPSVEAARDREQAILDEGFGHPLLLNLSDNSRTPNSGYDRSEAIRHMVETKNTPEFKEKISHQAKQRWEDPAYRKNHIQKAGEAVTVNGVEYGSVREASRGAGVSIATIRSRMGSGEVDLTNIRKPTRSVSVKGVIFASVHEAATSEGIADNTMTYRCQNPAPQWSDHHYVD